MSQSCKIKKIILFSSVLIGIWLFVQKIDVFKIAHKRVQTKHIIVVVMNKEQAGSLA